MNTAIVIAGGTGSRMRLQVPKQFTLVNHKPIIAYTLQAFQDHPSIAAIGVVCISGWEDILSDYAKQHDVTKLEWIIPGGRSAQESIFNGVKHLEGRCQADDMVVIHDGIRPLVEPEIISSVLSVCQEHGNGVTSLPYNEQIFRIDEDDPDSTVAYIPRDTLRRVATPQAYRFDLLLSRYKEAFAKEIGIGPSSYTNTMMVDLGERLHFAAGSDLNIKLTTPEDLQVFQAHIHRMATENEWSAT